MKMKFKIILSTEAALEAVKQDGDALQYVKNKVWFLKIAAELNIDVEID